MELIENELRKENETYRLKQYIINEQTRQKTTQLVTLSIIFLLSMLLSVIGIVYYRQRLKAIVSQRKIALLQGQELERERIAKELHDHVGGMLAGIKAHIPTTVVNHQRLVHWIDELYDSVRTLSHNLHTGVLHEEGLQQACLDFIDLINKQDKISLVVHGQARSLPPFASTMAFRIIQELLTNAMHHAQASRIMLTLLFADNKLLISVVDDGIGLTAKKNSTGLGLRSVKERVGTLGGHIEFDSSEKIGTTILITLPVDI